MPCNRSCERRRHGISYLTSYLDLRTGESEVIREAHQTGCFAVGYRAMLIRV